MKQRSIVAVILLTLVTCGIYGIYWYYVTMKALDDEGGASNMPVIAQFLLLFVYVGSILFGLNADANLNAIRAKRGLPQEDKKTLYIVLGIFIPIVLICLVQNDINKLCE